MSLGLIYDWTATLGLVFGGCCSNAITLEQLTSQYPNAGSLITLFQFVLISLHGLPRHITWTSYGPRFRPRRIPLMPYVIQVVLYYLVSLLNNAAFGYDIPMSVHIIFRSGGLIVSMLLGWLVSGKRYNLTQIVSVLLVTIGVFLTTFSATRPASPSQYARDDVDVKKYLTGIIILSLALVFSGFLGLVQDWTYSTFGRAEPSTTALDSRPPQWQESLFYLHFLSLPMFILIRNDIKTQLHVMSNEPPLSLSTTLPFQVTGLTSVVNLVTRVAPMFTSTQAQGNKIKLSLHIPSAYVPLLLNTITQLLCASGVHRLTTRVSSLTVTLVLVVRKAVSLFISILGAHLISNGKPRTVDHRMMWTGAAFVLLGTVLYSVGTGKKRATSIKDKKE